MEGLFCNAWTVGPDGSLAACELAVSPGDYEVADYAPEQRKLERTGLLGGSVMWAAAANKAEMHRTLLYAKGTGCFLYDRVQKRATQLFSSAPNVILGVAPSPDGRYIYFTRNVRDSDLWLARLAN